MIKVETDKELFKFFYNLIGISIYGRREYASIHTIRGAQLRYPTKLIFNTILVRKYLDTSLLEKLFQHRIFSFVCCCAVKEKTFIISEYKSRNLILICKDISIYNYELIPQLEFDVCIDSFDFNRLKLRSSYEKI